jgi:putative transcriptional regulator
MSALVLLATLALAAPLQGPEPAIGRLLIATPQVGSFFAESVVVLVDHGEHGSLGLIVNRPLALSLAELQPDVPSAKGHGEPAFFGGPVAPGQMLLLVRSARPPPGAAPVLDGVSVSGSRDTLSALLEHPPAGGELRAYVGYAGWAPGQLAAEIARGDWLVAPGDAGSVFTHEPAELWQTLLKKHQGIRVEWQERSVARHAKAVTLWPPWRSAAASSGSPMWARARSSTR